MRAHSVLATPSLPAIVPAPFVRWGVTPAISRREQIVVLAEALYEAVYRDSGDAVYRDYKVTSITAWLALQPWARVERADVHGLVVAWCRDE